MPTAPRTPTPAAAAAPAGDRAVAPARPSAQPRVVVTAASGPGHEIPSYDRAVTGALEAAFERGLRRAHRVQ